MGVCMPKPNNKIKNVKFLTEDSGPWGDPSSIGGHAFGESPASSPPLPWDNSCSETGV
jgi:hypothetical protein